jgi:hypothetical protein
VDSGQEKRAAYSLRVVIFQPMYKCKYFPYPIGYIHPDLGKVILPSRKVPSILKTAYQFRDEWKRETPGPHHYIQVKCFGNPPQKVFISPAFRHIEELAPRNVARRYRFLPCVKELLMECTNRPAPTKRGSLLLKGLAPPYGEVFAVIIEENAEIAPGLYGYRLSTFYPVSK